MAKVSEGVARKLNRIERCLNAMEQGKYSDLDIHACCDYIAWVAKYKKAPRSVWEPLCEKATEVCKIL